MLKKVLACSVVSLFMFCFAVGFTLATDAGPADITLTDASSKKPKPAQFPHLKHQEAFSCGDCHHSMEDGKQVAYVEGQEIQKCDACHNEQVLAGKTKGKLKLDTLKGAGHGNCLECHKDMAKENAELKEKKIDKCSACHPKN